MSLTAHPTPGGFAIDAQEVARQLVDDLHAVGRHLDGIRLERVVPGLTGMAVEVKVSDEAFSRAGD